MSTKSEDKINFIACSKIFASNNAVKVVRDMVAGGYCERTPCILFGTKNTSDRNIILLKILLGDG